MSLKKIQNHTQDVRVAEFVFNWDDTAVNPSGVTVDFKVAQANAFDCMGMPPNSVVVGGDVTTETAITGSTAYNMIVGDSGSTNRYLGTTDKVTAARTALVPTGFVNASGLPVRITVTPTVANATAGKVRVRVEYVVVDRANEVV